MYPCQYIVIIACIVILNSTRENMADSDLPVVTQPDFKFKYLLIGDTEVGKTSMLIRFASDVFAPSTIATIGKTSFGFWLERYSVW